MTPPSRSDTRPAVWRLRDRLQGFVHLMRPANIVTAWADVLAGVAVAGFGVGMGPDEVAPVGWLLLSTTGLYGGGVVLNDVFDAALDARERPERPIPSGRVSRSAAAGLGVLLLLVGVGAAAMVSAASAGIAVLVAAGAVLYDAVAKHHAPAGPLVMGACRGGNLLLGVSLVPGLVGSRWFLAVLPLAYIAAITAVSRGEVHGGSRWTGRLALVLLGGVVLGVLALELLPAFSVFRSAPFLMLFAAQVGPPFVRAARHPRPASIRSAVRAGVLALISLDAALAAGFGGWLHGVVVLLLWPLSVFLARRFAVT